MTTVLTAEKMEQLRARGTSGDRMARIGAAVNARLQATQGVQKVETDLVDMYVYHDFLPSTQRDFLMSRIDQYAFPSKLYAADPDAEFRTSSSCDMDRHDWDIRAIDQRISHLLGVMEEFGETLQGQRYAIGQQFKPHQDYFHTTEPYWKAEALTGGQRTWTAMVFLNDVEEGGQTEFTDLGVSVEPRAGTLLIWNNIGKDGEPNALTIHAGRPVVRGTKYIITKWFRENPWGI